jgi:hypothetical protein
LPSPAAVAGVRFVAARRHRRKLEIERKSVPFRFCDAPGVATGKKGAPGRAYTRIAKAKYHKPT